MQTIKYTVLTLKTLCILALVVWPAIAMSIVMAGGGPHVSARTMRLIHWSFYSIIIFPIVVFLVLWFDRKKYREAYGLKYRFLLWICPAIDLCMALFFLIYALNGRNP